MLVFRALLIFVGAGSLVLSQEALTNDAIVKMVKAGLSETVILSMVSAQPGNYSTKVDDLIALKQAGVSDKVIAAVAAKATGPTVAIPPSGKAADAVAGAVVGPAMEIGVYFKKGDPGRKCFRKLSTGRQAVP